MARTPPALIDPSLLKWARSAARMTTEQAAKMLSVTPERLLAWEAGEEPLTIAQLRAAARVYKRPLAVFYLPEPPRDFQPLRDFRRLPETEEERLSPQLQAAIRRAHSLREAALELRDMAGDPPREAPRIDPAPRDPEAFAALARELLGVGLATQLEWTDPGRALSGWTAALEDLDVMVLQAQGIDAIEMRGFSIGAASLPVVVLNGGDSTRARIFTLLHEYMHVLLRAAGVCDLHERGGPGATDDVEVFCNRAAAAVLLPGDIFRSDPRVEAAPGGGIWPDSTLRELSERYGVSREVVVRRLFSLGLTSWEFLREKTAEYRRAYDERKEREKEKSSGGPGWHRMRVRDFGAPYLRLALDAYYRDDITASELSDYLQVKINKLAKLEEELLLAEARR